MNADDAFGSVHDRLQAMLAAALADATMDEGRTRSVLQEMIGAVEELRVADEELTVQGEQLAASTEAIDAERSRYAELFDFAPDAYVGGQRCRRPLRRERVHGGAAQGSDGSCET